MRLFNKNFNSVFAIGMIILGISSCSKQETKDDTNEATVEIPLQDCNIKFDNVDFTKSVNDAVDNVKIVGDSLLLICGEKKDFFCDPNDGILSNNTAPILLTEVNNTRPFTFTAKVTPEFTEEGLYNACDLYVYVDPTLWQKFAFEQDERGNHRIVTVRTQGTSDDNNHDIVETSSVYLKYSSDTHTIASYYSIDGNEWQLVRLYENNYPETVYLGLSTQCPMAKGCTGVFTDVSLTTDNVSDFRMGN